MATTLPAGLPSPQTLAEGYKYTDTEDAWLESDMLKSKSCIQPVSVRGMYRALTTLLRPDKPPRNEEEFQMTWLMGRLSAYTVDFPGTCNLVHQLTDKTVYRFQQVSPQMKRRVVESYVMPVFSCNAAYNMVTEHALNAKSLLDPVDCKRLLSKYSTDEALAELLGSPKYTLRAQELKEALFTHFKWQAASGSMEGTGRRRSDGSQSGPAGKMRHRMLGDDQDDLNAAVKSKYKEGERIPTKAQAKAEVRMRKKSGLYAIRHTRAWAR